MPDEELLDNGIRLSRKERMKWHRPQRTPLAWRVLLWVIALSLLSNVLGAVNLLLGWLR